MDHANPAEGPDTFSRVLPLPFRLQFELILGIWLWALNLHGFHILNIDIFTLIHYPARPTQDEPPLHTCTYRLATLLTTLWLTSLLAFWHATGAQPDLVTSHAWIPNLTGGILLLALVAPRPSSARALLGSPHATGVRRLLTGLVRCAPGGIAKPKGDKFGDVLLADALTSYAKPISELFVLACMLVTGAGTTAAPDRTCGRALVVPAALAWPFAVRLRQCVKEGQWANAAKYGTAFPVIIFSTLQSKDPAWRTFW
jgi:hypothetical protein